MTPSMKFAVVAGKGRGSGEGGPPTDRETHSNAAVGKCAISSRRCKPEGKPWQAFRKGARYKLNKNATVQNYNQEGRIRCLLLLHFHLITSDSKKASSTRLQASLCIVRNAGLLKIFWLGLPVLHSLTCHILTLFIVREPV